MHLKRIMQRSVTFAVSLFMTAGLLSQLQARTIHEGIVRSDKGQLGVGGELGLPTGLSAKYRLNDQAGVDAGLGYDFNGFFVLRADYLFHFPGVLGNDNEFVADVTPYVGGGLALLFQTSSTLDLNRAYFRSTQGSTGFVLRIPIGAEWTPHATPFGVYAEIAPGLGLAPATFGLFEFDVGARFYIPGT
jgi:hypothetical protein